MKTADTEILDMPAPLLRRTFVASIAGVLLSTVATQLHAQAEPAAKPAAPEVTVYRNPSCGCCDNWVEHMRHHGFKVVIKGEAGMLRIRTEHGVPATLESCHTAVVDGYVIEGHVPADVIEQLLKDRPAVAGIAVPGMPIGSPGMEMEGREPRPYDVIAFTRDGRTSVYAKR